MDTRDSDLGDDSMVSKKSIKLRRKKFHLQKKRFLCKNFVIDYFSFITIDLRLSKILFKSFYLLTAEKATKFMFHLPQNEICEIYCSWKLSMARGVARMLEKRKKKLIYKYLLAQQTINRTWKLHLTTL